MKNQWIGVVITATAIGAAPSIARADLQERIAAHLLASHYHLEAQDVLRAAGEAGADIFEAGPIFELAKDSHRSPFEVARLRRTTGDWDDVGFQLGLRYRAFEHLRRDHLFRPDEYWEHILNHHYGTSYRQFDFIHGEMSVANTVIAVVIGNNAHRPPEQIAEEFRRDRSWEHVAREFGVDPEQWYVRESDRGGYRHRERGDGRFGGG